MAYTFLAECSKFLNDYWLVIMETPAMNCIDKWQVKTACRPYDVRCRSATMGMNQLDMLCQHQLFDFFLNFDVERLVGMYDVTLDAHCLELANHFAASKREANGCDHTFVQETYQVEQM